MMTYGLPLLFLIKLVNKSIHSDIDQCAGLSSFCSGANLIISSILRMVMAASVANRSELIFDIIGSNTPAFKLLRGVPLVKSNPQNLSYSLLGSLYPSFWEAA